MLHLHLILALYSLCIEVNHKWELSEFQHLMRSSPEIIKRWSNEAQEAVNSDSQMPQYHGLGLLYSMRKSDKLAVNKMVQKYSKRGFRSAHAQLFLVNFCFRFPHNFRGSDFFSLFQVRVAARVIQEEGLGWVLFMELICCYFLCHNFIVSISLLYLNIAPVCANYDCCTKAMKSEKISME